MSAGDRTTVRAAHRWLVRRRRWAAALLVVVSALAVACSGDGPTAPGESGNWKKGTAVHAVEIGDLTRSYVLHVPPRLRRGTGATALPYPLVIVLHGSSADASAIQQASGMDSVADRALFLVAYPNATGGSFGVYASDWNAGTCCGGAYRDGVDDLGFLAALIKHVSAHVPVDAKHVYVAGFSSGGMMAYHAACKLSMSIAAIGVVSGGLVDDSCHPAKGVSLWAVHGTDDAEVAFDESSSTLPSSRVLPAAYALPPSVQFWSALQKCTGGSAKALSAHVTKTTFVGCINGDVEFNAIEGGTHGWPGGPIDPGSQPPMNELKAAVAMWTFFARHTRN